MLCSRSTKRPLKMWPTEPELLSTVRELRRSLELEIVARRNVGNLVLMWKRRNTTAERDRDSLKKAYQP